MKTGLILFLLFLGLAGGLHAQRCYTSLYGQELIKNNPALAERIETAGEFISSYTTGNQNNTASRIQGTVIKIPVVVHILYHFPSEKIADAVVQSQLDALNRCFRRQNADSVNTPAFFKPLAADCEIEFYLATSDSRKRSTTGIIKKYTPMEKWAPDDRMKFSSNLGDDAWDPNSYLNIWVCNLDRLAGYSSLPGSDAAKDGIVIDFGAFGASIGGGGYSLGKTAVHELGHWLGLKHIWGDENCGDDGVADTPKQASYTIGCPTNIRITCGNGPHGDMYMNYMDLTGDACLNLFTLGQKNRMRTLFETGGARNAILSSAGLDMPLIYESPLPESDPKWLHPQLYPNPVNSVLTLDLTYDPRWIGRWVQIGNLQGQIIMQVQVTGKIMQIDLKKIPKGIYFLAAKKADGESMIMRFVRL